MRIFALANTAVAALAIAFSGGAFAAPQDHRFELVQVTRAGPGKTDVTVRVVRSADGAPVTEAVIQATNADMAPGGMTAMTGKAVFVSAERPDHQVFRVETGMSGTWALHLTATVPSPPRIDRTYFPANKTTLVRTVRGEREVVHGTLRLALSDDTGDADAPQRLLGRLMNEMAWSRHALRNVGRTEHPISVRQRHRAAMLGI